MEKISAFGIKRPKKSIRIFVGTLLPRTVWIRKIDVTPQLLLNYLPIGKFSASVAGNGFNRSIGKYE